MGSRTTWWRKALQLRTRWFGHGRRWPSPPQPLRCRPRAEPLEDRITPAHDITIATGGLATIPAGATMFSDTNDFTIDPSAFAGVSADVNLQANNDITFSNDTTLAAGFKLIAQAGQSILINANVSTTADINFSANDTAADGTNRGGGNAVVSMSSGTTVNAAGGNI